jgi:gas vesicle protein
MKRNSDSRVDGQHAGGNFTVGLLLGALVGLGAMFIYGTKKGKKVRKQFEKELTRAGKQAIRVSKKAKKGLDENVSKAEKVVEKAQVEVDLAVKEAKERATEAKQAVKLATKKVEQAKRVFMRKGKPLK